MKNNTNISIYFIGLKRKQKTQRKVSMIGYLILVIVIYWWINRRIHRYEKNKRQVNIPREVVINLFFVYMLCVYYVVFAPFHLRMPQFDTSTWNLNPFVEIIYQFKRKVNGIPVYGLLYLVGNIILFVPLGLFIPMLFKTFNKFVRIALLGLFGSLSIEWIQTTFTSRYFDIDDVIFNTLGAAAGYVIFIFIRFIGSKISILDRLFVKVQKL